MTQGEKTVTLELSINQLNTVLAGVVKLPIEAGLDTFNTIQQQAQQQLGAPSMANPTEGPLSNKVVQ